MASLYSTDYGKERVRLMRVRRDGSRYSICELMVGVELQLATTKDYKHGDNSDVVATDSMKNTVHAMAKKNEINSPEEFCILLCKHFLGKYNQVIRCCISAEQAPWERVNQEGTPHSHAFILQPSVKRFCNVTQKKGGKLIVSGGLCDMKVLKTTKSGFVGFVRDEFTTLPEVTDRTFCTRVYCNYQYQTIDGVDFNSAWSRVKGTILDVFAGPPSTGAYSLSVQNTIYEAAVKILGQHPSIQSVELHMPNIHYFTADLSKLGISNHGELLLPSNEPQGMIKATVSRTASKL